jgi:hypothetical protein
VQSASHVPWQLAVQLASIEASQRPEHSAVKLMGSHSTVHPPESFISQVALAETSMFPHESMSSLPQLLSFSHAATSTDAKTARGAASR